MDTAHPITILQKMYKKMAILLIPIARGGYHIITRDPHSFRSWLSGVWFDILLLLFLIVISVINWRSVKYKAGEETILLKKGVFIKSEKTVRRRFITSVTCHRPAIFRLLGAESVYIDTEGGYTKHSDMDITVKSADRHKFYAVPESGKTYRPRLFDILFLSLCVTNTFASTVYAVLLINEAGKIIGRDIITEFIGYISSAASYIALAVLAMEILGILRNFLYFSRFSVRRAGDALYFENGFFSKTHSVCRVGAVNYIDRRQNLISSLFKLSMVFIQCTGYGKARKKEALLVPAATEQAVDNCIKMLIPELQRSKPGSGRDVHSLKPSPRSFMRYVRTPLIICAFIIAAGIAAMRFIILPYFTRWAELAKFTVFMLVVPFALFAVVRVLAFRKAGIFYEGADTGMVTVCSYRGLNIHTVTFHVSKISHIKIKRSVFQKNKNICDVMIYTGGEGGHKHAVMGVLYDEDFISEIERAI